MPALMISTYCFQIYPVGGLPCVKDMPRVGSRKSQMGTLWGTWGWRPSNWEGAELSCRGGEREVLGRDWGEGRWWPETAGSGVYSPSSMSWEPLKV